MIDSKDIYKRLLEVAAELERQSAERKEADLKQLLTFLKLSNQESIIERIRLQGMPTTVFVSAKLENDNLSQFLGSIGLRCVYSHMIASNLLIFQWNSEIDDPFDEKWYDR